MSFSVAPQLFTLFLFRLQICDQHLFIHQVGLLQDLLLPDELVFSLVTKHIWAATPYWATITIVISVVLLLFQNCKIYAQLLSTVPHLWHLLDPLLLFLLLQLVRFLSLAERGLNILVFIRQIGEALWRHLHVFLALGLPRQYDFVQSLFPSVLVNLQRLLLFVHHLYLALKVSSLPPQLSHVHAVTELLQPLLQPLILNIEILRNLVWVLKLLFSRSCNHFLIILLHRLLF